MPQVLLRSLPVELLLPEHCLTSTIQTAHQLLLKSILAPKLTVETLYNFKDRGHAHGGIND